MSSYTRLLFHIVFATKGRTPALVADHRRELFAYMHGVIRNNGAFLYRLNGVDDHVHLLVGLSGTTNVADFVKLLKTSTNSWIRGAGKFPLFESWQAGYGAFSVGWDGREQVINYIKAQEEHHRAESFIDELRRLLLAAGLDWDERYLP